MKRGDLVTVSISGDYGKPRPALVVQSDAYDQLDSITVLPLTSETLSLPNTRVMLQPTEENALLTISYVMTDKASTLRREKVGRLIGRVSDDDLNLVSRALAVFLGFV